MSDIFTRDRFQWLDSLAADPEMNPGDFIVGYAIATSVKRNSGNKVLVSASNDPADVVCEAWIGAGEIAEKIGMSTGTVFARIRRLEERGYIQIDNGKPGSGHAHHYRLVEKGQPADYSKGQRADHSKKPKGQRADHSSSEKVSGLTNKGQPADMNPLYPLKEKTFEGESPQPDLDEKDSGRRGKNPSSEIETKNLDADFKSWYFQYPRRIAKEKARQAYFAVIKKKLATPEELLAGAMRANAQFDEDVRCKGLAEAERFTKHPATWLTGGCWADEPATPTGDTIDGNGNQISRPPPPDRAPRRTSLSGMDIAMAGYRGERT
jgi:hypothetical protein